MLAEMRERPVQLYAVASVSEAINMQGANAAIGRYDSLVGRKTLVRYPAVKVVDDELVATQRLLKSDLLLDQQVRMLPLEYSVRLHAG